MARSTTDRLSEKTVERQFLYEMETDFELAPAASRAVLATAQQVLLVSGGEPRQGQMRVTVVSVEEPSGKPLAAMKKVSVVVTVDGGLEDLEVLKQFGVQGQRRVRVLRMTEEAVDQGGVLTQEDLARLCQSDVRTIRRDLVVLRGEGHWVPTRGAVKEIGRRCRPHASEQPNDDVLRDGSPTPPDRASRSTPPGRLVCHTACYE
jgi:hypothetical protein